MKHPCNHPSCPNLLPHGARYCKDHIAAHLERRAKQDHYKRYSDPRTADAAKFRNSTKWRKIRAQILASNPICADPLGHHATSKVTHSATQVHHIIGIAERIDLATHADNLMPICTACHAQIEREVRADANASKLR